MNNILSFASKYLKRTFQKGRMKSCMKYLLNTVQYVQYSAFKYLKRSLEKILMESGPSSMILVRSIY